MDTIKVFIKMCEKAIEIQKLWKPHGWDIVCRYDDRCGDILIYQLYGEYGHYISTQPVDCKEKVIWLPKQDQLQKIVDPRDGSQHTLMESFWNWCNKDYPLNTNLSNFAVFKTMEQLWLAYCQKKLYNKIWDNEKEEWVKK